MIFVSEKLHRLCFRYLVHEDASRERTIRKLGRGGGGENGDERTTARKPKAFFSERWEGRLWPTTLHALGFTLPINSYRWQPFPSQRLLPPSRQRSVFPFNSIISRPFLFSPPSPPFLPFLSLPWNFYPPLSFLINLWNFAFRPSNGKKRRQQRNYSVLLAFEKIEKGTMWCSVFWAINGVMASFHIQNR